MTKECAERVGAVVIGRNEGERLELCLRSIVGKVRAVVYVDSGSTDGSVAVAGGLGVDAVELDLSIPFTAARARNAGFERLLECHPDLEYIQFVDGDCEVVPGWLNTAFGELDARPEVAVVCGRRRERFPEASIYNRLCDIEWDTPVGTARACGGDAMMRVEAIRQVKGFDPAVIAAEDDEICVRLRLAGWRILRVAAEMTLHDAAITRFGQWWKRAMRAGHAYAQVAAMHGKSAVRHFARQTRSVCFWGGVLPLFILAMAWPTRGCVALLLTGYVLLAFRVYRSTLRKDHPRAVALAYAVQCTIAKFPQMVGMLKYALNVLRRKQSIIIEYKGPAHVNKVKAEHIAPLSGGSSAEE